MNVSSSIAMAFVEKYLVVSSCSQDLVSLAGHRTFTVDNEAFRVLLESELRAKRIVFDGETIDVIVMCLDPRLIPVKPDGHVLEFPFSGGITFGVRAGPKYVTFQMLPRNTAGQAPVYYDYSPDEGIWSPSWNPATIVNTGLKEFHTGLVDAIIQYFKQQ